MSQSRIRKVQSLLYDELRNTHNNFGIENQIFLLWLVDMTILRIIKDDFRIIIVN